MKFNFIRFISFLVLPVLIISIVVFGVYILEKNEEPGKFFIPKNPVAHEPSKFSYQLLNPKTQNPLNNASVHLEIVKTGKINSWLYVGYLREDNHGTGLVYKTDLLLFDGKIELNSILWDAGTYSVSITANSPELSNPIKLDIPVEVKVPLGQIIRTIILFIAIFLAAFISGHDAGLLENPFKGKDKTRKVQQFVVFVIVGMLITLFSNFNPVLADNNDSNSKPDGLHKYVKSGVQLELGMNPEEPVQKGAPVQFLLTFRDMKTGQLLNGIDASLTLYHVDDNLNMFTTQTEIQEGQYEFSYAFPDTAEYRLTVHAAPNSPQSTLPAPFNGEISFEVPPVHPDLSAQLKAASLMLIAMLCGFITGTISAKRKKAAS